MHTAAAVHSAPGTLWTVSDMTPMVSSVDAPALSSGAAPTHDGSPATPCAASWLTCDLLGRGGLRLLPVTRTSLGVHYVTGVAEVPVLTVTAPTAVRLPASVVTGRLPGPGPLLLDGDGILSEGGSTWQVTRWWKPPRPRGLTGPRCVEHHVCFPAGFPVPPTTYDGLDPAMLLGAGQGLTPAGDDVLAGALVAAHATDDPRLADWQQRTRRALASRTTTAVSRALLHHALDGYATPELAGYLTALCQGGDTTAALRRLVSVGHSSGRALLAGVLHTLVTRQPVALASGGA